MAEKDIFDKLANGELTGKEVGSVPAPAPAPDPSASAAPAAAAEGSGSDTGTPPPPAPAASSEAPAPQPAPATDSSERMVATLKEISDQNRYLVEGFQKHLTEQQMREQMRMDKLLQQQAPELTAAQRAERVSKAFEAINTDPEAYVEGIVQQRLTALREEIKKEFAPKTAESERNRITGEHLQKLYQREDGQVARPELADPKFRELMLSEKVSNEVYKNFFTPGTKAEDVLQSPVFYLESYYLAKRLQAEDFEKAKQQSTQDQLAQQQVLQKAGDPVTGGKTPTGSAPKAKDGNAELRRQIVQAESPSDILRKGFQK